MHFPPTPDAKNPLHHAYNTPPFFMIIGLCGIRPADYERQVTPRLLSLPEGAGEQRKQPRAEVLREGLQPRGAGHLARAQGAQHDRRVLACGMASSTMHVMAVPPTSSARRLFACLPSTRVATRLASLEVFDLTPHRDCVTQRVLWSLHLRSSYILEQSASFASWGAPVMSLPVCRRYTGA